MKKLILLLLLATLTGVKGTPEMSPLADPVITNDSAIIQWSTSASTISLLRYGPTRSEMTNLFYLPGPTQTHEANIPLPALGERVYYEILKGNADPYDPPAINSFVNAASPISQIVIRNYSISQIGLNWQTSEPTSSLFRYGLDPNSLDHVIEDLTFQIYHNPILPEDTERGTYTYEIFSTDALGNTSTSVGTFEILPEILRAPFLQKAAPSSMTLNWRTFDRSETLLRFGQDPTNLDQFASGTSSAVPFIEENNLIKDHSVTLTGLTPATKYYYQIANNYSPAPASDLTQFFTTPPLPGTPAKTRIWVIGDSGYASPDVINVKNAYLQYTADTPTDLWLMLGDNAYGSGTDDQYQTALFRLFPELLKNTPVWPTVGNHDGYSNHYYGIFDLPTNGQSGGVPSGTEKYYSFDHGNIHFICLNSEEDPPGMLDWLENDLQSTRADWIIAFFHHGPYTKGSHDSDRESEHFAPRQNYLPILESYGVDLILTGHSHHYERSHLLDGHYGLSSTYNAQNHAVDPGPGSPRGFTDPQTGLFQYTSEHTPYQKPIAALNSGQVSATVGSSSIVTSWSYNALGGDRSAITNPHPHPVHVATLRALGSMIIDVDGHSLKASYLDSNGQIRDQFEINKTPEVSPAIDWWQQNFGPTSYPYLADWFSDPDHDTNNNLTEYVLGGDPLANDQLIEATTTNGLYNGEPAQWFSVQYDLREGTTANVEASQNLISFTASGIETHRLTDPDANGIARWESRVRRINQRTLFFQIKVSR